jgi:flavin-dependent dehydrogenase
MADENYDVVVVGARAAGAATAMLLAKQGMRVLVLDRDRYGTDTLSTHALMRGGVLLLSRWGLLDRIVDAGTPAIRRTTFDYGTETISVAIKPSPGVDALYAPRRMLLDRVLVDAAVAAGGEVRFGVSVTGLRRDRSGRVAGVIGRDRTGATLEARAGLVVGADGVRSKVAREVGARTLHSGTGAGAVMYGYWSGLDVDGYEWFYRPGHSAGLIPTNAGEVCVFAGVPAEDLPAAKGRAYRRLLATATGGDRRLAAAQPPSRVRTWIGRPGFIRKAQGPGWALVGDAGFYQDPLSTHGITDALRDAEVLARSVAAGGSDALRAFADQRDEIIRPLFDVVDRIAGYDWDPAEVPRLLRKLSAAMGREVDLLEDPVASVPAGSRRRPNRCQQP